MKSLVEFSQTVSKFLAVIASLVVASALIEPATFLWVQPTWINPLLSVVMFGMGLTIKTKDFILVLKKPKDIAVGVLIPFTVMSTLAWLLVQLFNLETGLAIGVILVGSAPSGTASNVIAYLAGGDMPLSVTITSVKTLLSPLLTPLAVLVFLGQTIEIAVVPMIITIVQIVLAPVIAGLVINHFFGKFVEKIVGILPLISVITIVTIIGAIVSRQAENILTSGFIILLIVLLHNVIGYAIGYGLIKLFKGDDVKAVTIAIETGIQNSGLAASLATTHFALHPLAAVPGALFSIMQNVTGSIDANWASARLRKKGLIDDN